MISKENSARFYGITLATMFSIVVMLMIYGLWPAIPVALAGLMFIGFWTGFYLTGVWVCLRKFPTSSHEFRRQRKEFYEWLRSQRH